jgi:hypothetical protein
VLVNGLASLAEGRIEAYVSDAPGVFRRTNVTQPQGTVSRFVVGDTDRDGRLDIVARTDLRSPFNVPPPPDPKTTLHRFPGGGDGSFGAETWARPSPGLVDFALGDVDADGLSDLVVLERVGNNDELRILQAMPDGTFKEPENPRFSEPSRADVLTRVHVADLNGDGKLEVIVVYRDLVRVLRGE